ncbi:MAG: phosphotransferase [Anaerolineales bacterium]|nr:phosphotransferase [Anaerolineales bacterium]
MANTGNRQQREFYDLTYYGRARRLREMGKLVLERYPVRVKQIRLLTIETNGIFRVDTEDGTRYMLRISDPKNTHEEAEIRSEIAWLNALIRETDLRIPAPVLNTMGEFVNAVQMEGIPKKRFCVLFSWIQGKDLAQQITPQNLSLLGEVTARLHEHARQFQPPPDFRVRTMDSVFPYADPSFEEVEPVILFEKDLQPVVSPEQRRIFQRGAELVQQEIDRLYNSAEPLSVLHGDLHQWNVKIYRGQLAVLDFEDLMWGYPIQDIGTTWMYFFEEPGAQELRRAYREGYERILPWPERYQGQLEIMVAARVFNLVNYILNSPVPEDQQIAPDYVKRSVKRLKELLPL